MSKMMNTEMEIDKKLDEVIAGMAKLGEIYLRIMGKINAFYKEEPLAKFEAAKIALKLGYSTDSVSIRELVDKEILDGGERLPEEDVEMLYRFAEKYMDPVLTTEVTREFAYASVARRKEMITEMQEQMAIFPDASLGMSDFVKFGYFDVDLFPVHMEMAQMIMEKTELHVYAVHADGSSTLLRDSSQLERHNWHVRDQAAGMAGLPDRRISQRKSGRAEF